MEKFWDVTLAFWGNYMLISGIIGWFSAQIIKIFTNLFVKKKLDLRMFFANGGMPSSHSSTVVALTIAAAIQYGFNSAPFAISGILAVIVMNDAFGVRWQAGKQAQIINKMIVELFQNFLGEGLLPLFIHGGLQVDIALVIVLHHKLGLHILAEIQIKGFLLRHFPAAENVKDKITARSKIGIDVIKNFTHIVHRKDRNRK